MLREKNFYKIAGYDYNIGFPKGNIVSVSIAKYLLQNKDRLTWRKYNEDG